MEHIIIYGMGRLFQKYQEQINWQKIVAIADKKIESTSEYCGVPLIRPEEIERQTYDYVVIFSIKYFDEIKSLLTGTYFVADEKIISWKALISDNICTDAEIIGYYKKIIREFQFHRILDVGMPLFDKYFYVAEEILSDYPMHMDGVGDSTYLMGKSLYQTVYKKIGECNDRYEVALLWNGFDDIEENIMKLRYCARFILLHSFYSSNEKNRIEKIDNILQKYPVKKRLSMMNGIFWLVDMSPRIIEEKVTIYVVTHKPYQVQCNDLYQPICVGNSYNNACYLSEKTGDNITYLNEKINECTALYWIWKNTDTKYVGLNHYRRYFYNNGVCNAGNYLDKETAYKYMQEYDIVLAMASPLYEKSVFDQVRDSMDSNLCMRALRIMRDSVNRHQPDYLDVFDYVIRGHKIHLCNMFLTHRDILNAYCEWLFSFLIEAAEELNVHGYGAYDKRAMGFWAERMLTTWLLKQDLKIKELPYVVTTL